MLFNRGNRDDVKKTGVANWLVGGAASVALIGGGTFAAISAFQKEQAALSEAKRLQKRVALRPFDPQMTNNFEKQLLSMGYSPKSVQKIIQNTRMNPSYRTGKNEISTDFLQRTLSKIQPYDRLQTAQSIYKNQINMLEQKDHFASFLPSKKKESLFGSRGTHVVTKQTLNKTAGSLEHNLVTRIENMLYGGDGLSREQVLTIIDDLEKDFRFDPRVKNELMGVFDKMKDAVDTRRSSNMLPSLRKKAAANIAQDTLKSVNTVLFNELAIPTDGLSSALSFKDIDSVALSIYENEYAQLLELKKTDALKPQQFHEEMMKLVDKMDQLTKTKSELHDAAHKLKNAFIGKSDNMELTDGRTAAGFNLDPINVDDMNITLQRLKDAAVDPKTQKYSHSYDSLIRRYDEAIKLVSRRVNNAGTVSQLEIDTLRRATRTIKNTFAESASKLSKSASPELLSAIGDAFNSLKSVSATLRNKNVETKRELASLRSQTTGGIVHLHKTKFIELATERGEPLVISKNQRNNKVLNRSMDKAITKAYKQAVGSLPTELRKFIPRSLNGASSSEAVKEMYRSLKMVQPNMKAAIESVIRKVATSAETGKYRFKLSTEMGRINLHIFTENGASVIMPFDIVAGNRRVSTTGALYDTPSYLESGKHPGSKILLSREGYQANQYVRQMDDILTNLDSGDIAKAQHVIDRTNRNVRTNDMYVTGEAMGKRNLILDTTLNQKMVKAKKNLNAVESKLFRNKDTLNFIKNRLSKLISSGNASEEELIALYSHKSQLEEEIVRQKSIRNEMRRNSPAGIMEVAETNLRSMLEKQVERIDPNYQVRIISGDTEVKTDTNIWIGEKVKGSLQIGSSLMGGSKIVPSKGMYTGVNELDLFGLVNPTLAAKLQRPSYKAVTKEQTEWFLDQSLALAKDRDSALVIAEAQSKRVIRGFHGASVGTAAHFEMAAANPIKANSAQAVIFNIINSDTATYKQLEGGDMVIKETLAKLISGTTTTTGVIDQTSGITFNQSFTDTLRQLQQLQRNKQKVPSTSMLLRLDTVVGFKKDARGAIINTTLRDVFGSGSGGILSDQNEAYIRLANPLKEQRGKNTARFVFEAAGLENANFFTKGSDKRSLLPTNEQVVNQIVIDTMFDHHPSELSKNGSSLPNVSLASIRDNKKGLQRRLLRTNTGVSEKIADAAVESITSIDAIKHAKPAAGQTGSMFQGMLVKLARDAKLAMYKKHGKRMFTKDHQLTKRAQTEINTVLNRFVDSMFGVAKKRNESPTEWVSLFTGNKHVKLAEGLSVYGGNLKNLTMGLDTAIQINESLKHQFAINQDQMFDAMMNPSKETLDMLTSYFKDNFSTNYNAIVTEEDLKLREIIRTRYSRIDRSTEAGKRMLARIAKKSGGKLQVDKDGHLVLSSNTESSFGLFAGVQMRNAANKVTTHVRAIITAEQMQLLHQQTAKVAHTAGWLDVTKQKAGGVDKGVVYGLWERFGINQLSKTLADRVNSVSALANEKTLQFAESAMPIFANGSDLKSKQIEAYLLGRYKHGALRTTDDAFAIFNNSEILSSKFTAPDATKLRFAGVEGLTGAGEFSYEHIMQRVSEINHLEEDWSKGRYGGVNFGTLDKATVLTEEQFRNWKSIAGKVIDLRTNPQEVSVGNKINKITAVKLKALGEKNGDGFFEVFDDVVDASGKVTRRKLYIVDDMNRAAIRLVRALTDKTKDGTDKAIDVQEAFHDFFAAATNELSGKHSYYAQKGLKVRVGGSATGLARWGMNESIVGHLLDKKPDQSIGQTIHDNPFFGMQKIGGAYQAEVTDYWVSQSQYSKILEESGLDPKRIKEIITEVKTGKRIQMGVANRQSTMSPHFLQSLRVRIFDDKKFKAPKNTFDAAHFLNPITAMRFDADTDADIVNLVLAQDTFTGHASESSEMLRSMYDSMKIVTYDDVNAKGQTVKKINWLRSGKNITHTQRIVNTGSNFTDFNSKFEVIDTLTWVNRLAGVDTERGGLYVKSGLLDKLTSIGVSGKEADDIYQSIFVGSPNNQNATSAAYQKIMTSKTPQEIESAVTSFKNAVAQTGISQESKTIVNNHIDEMLAQRKAVAGQLFGGVSDKMFTQTDMMLGGMTEGNFGVKEKLRATKPTSGPTVSTEEAARKIINDMSTDYVKNFTNEKSATPAMWKQSRIAWYNMEHVSATVESMQSNLARGLSPEEVTKINGKLNEIGINDPSVIRDAIDQFHAYSRSTQQLSMSGKKFTPLTVKSWVDTFRVITGQTDISKKKFSENSTKVLNYVDALENMIHKDPNKILTFDMLEKEFVGNNTHGIKKSVYNFITGNYNMSAAGFSTASKEAIQKAGNHVGRADITSMDFIRYTMEKYAETGNEDWKKKAVVIADGMLSSQWSHDIRKQVNVKGPTKEISSEISNIIESYRTAPVDERQKVAAQMENYMIRQMTKEDFAAAKTFIKINRSSLVRETGISNKSFGQINYAMDQASEGIRPDAYYSNLRSVAESSGPMASQARELLSRLNIRDTKFKTYKIPVNSSETVANRMAQRMGLSAPSNTKSGAGAIGALAAVGGFLLTQALHPNVAPELGDVAGRGGEYWEHIDRKKNERNNNPVDIVLKNSDKSVRSTLRKMTSTKTAHVMMDRLGNTYGNQEMVLRRNMNIYSSDNAYDLGSSYRTDSAFFSRIQRLTS